jgi:hypothetical protein
MPKLPSHPLIYEVNTIAWLSELSRRAETPMTLASVPDCEWDDIAALGVNAVWLMGVWERSPAGLSVALANPGLRAEFRGALPDVTLEDIAASPYCVRRYVADGRFGGPAGLAVARRQLATRGVGLILDFVPNHLARDHPWVEAHPERFIHGTEEDLEADGSAFFRAGPHVIACGRDPYFPPWSDVAQVNAFAPGLRTGTAESLWGIASQCDGVRCDMAMLLMTDVFARTWGERAGPPPSEEFWLTVIGSVRARAPGFTFIAESYWDREWALQQQGFDYCYDKRLYDRLVHGDASPVRDHLLADRGYQDRLVRFIENHDEARAATVFGCARSRAAAALVAALPGAKLVHQGQLEGRRVRIPVFLTRWPEEPVNESLRAFYAALLPEIGAEPFRTGEWRLLDCSGWPDNDSYRHLIACSWGDGSSRRLIVVNFSAVRSDGCVWLPWDDLAAHDWRMADVLSGDVFDRAGPVLAAHGLYVDLAPWRFHWLNACHAAEGFRGHPSEHR